MTQLNDKLVLSDGTFKITHFCEEPNTGLMHVTMTVKRGFSDWSFSVPVPLWEQAAKVPELEATLELTRTDADEAVHDRDALRALKGDADAIGELQDQIRLLEKELADQKAKFPEECLWFCLNPGQKERYSAFQKERLEEVPDKSTSGGRFTIRFTPTGIGTAVRVSDCVGDHELDLSDYSDW